MVKIVPCRLTSTAAARIDVEVEAGIFADEIDEVLRALAIVDVRSAALIHRTHRLIRCTRMRLVSRGGRGGEGGSSGALGDQAREGRAVEPGGAGVDDGVVSLQRRLGQRQG